MNKVLKACAIGNIIEWYEFMVFGYLANIIANLFFPASSSLISLFKAFGVFAIGVLVRPLGGVFLGHIGDKYGRKSALTLSIFLMAIPTVAIGFLPTYETIGIIAPLALLLIRILQGLSMGGEYAGAMISLVEDSEPKKRGFYGSLAAFSLVLGMALGSFVSFLLQTLLTQKQMLSWGWRIPFIISIVGFVWGLYVRSRLEDSDVFTKQKEQNKLAKVPIKEAFKESSGAIFYTVFVQCFLAVGMYTMTIFFANYAKEQFTVFQSISSFALNTPGVLAIGFSALISGRLSDRFGVRKVLFLTSIAAFCAAYLVIPLIGDKTVVSFFIAHVTLSVLTGFFLGPIPSFLTQSFPVKTRYTCVALSNNLSMGIFGGTAPFMITYLGSYFESPFMQNYYLMISAFVSMIFLFYLQNKRAEQ